MPRCCVPNCDSGTFSEVRRTRTAGLRVRSYFTFPKNEDLLKKWKEVIFNNEEHIISKAKICELHFNESDVIKYDETILKDGTIYKIQRQRYILRNGAIPKLQLHKEKLKSNKMTEVQNDTENKEKLTVKILQDQIITPTYEFKLMQREASLSNSIILTDIESDKCQYDSQLKLLNICADKRKLKVYSGANREKHKNLSIQNEMSTTYFKRPIIENPVPLEISENDPLLINPDMYFNDITCKQEISDYQNENQVEKQKNDQILIELSKENLTNKNDDKMQTYNFFKLKNDLERKSLNISSSWAYVLQENISVTFAYVHPIKLNIQLYCIIDCNMNIQIAPFDRRLYLNANIKINSSADLVEYLAKLETQKCCDGTGIKNIYSKRCRGFISSNEEYKRSRGYHRCNFCRVSRKIMIGKEDTPLDIKLRIRQQNRKIRALQHKYTHLQRLILKKCQTSQDYAKNEAQKKEYKNNFENIDFMTIYKICD